VFGEPDVIHAMGLAWAVLAAMMAALWLVHLAIRNAAIVDVGWTIGVPITAVIFAARLNGGPRAWLIAALTIGWGVRLASHLLVSRVIGQPEEGRYVELRRGWRTHVGAKFFLFFQAQALLDLLLSLPFLCAASAGGPVPPVGFAAAGLWAIAIAGEALADWQLERFKRRPGARGRVCDEGLWRYSRHPTYFFEWLIWVAYALYATTTPSGWLGWTSPALMLFFLFRVTGIPTTEAQALRSRGEAYRRYQATTSAFVPWPRRRASRDA
jgi:steroid 5-alpha reductase family enzyme